MTFIHINQILRS